MDGEGKREKGWGRKIRVPVGNMKIIEDTDEYAGEEVEVKGTGSSLCCRVEELVGFSLEGWVEIEMLG